MYFRKTPEGLCPTSVFVCYPPLSVRRIVFGVIDIFFRDPDFTSVL